MKLTFILILAVGSVVPPSFAQNLPESPGQDTTTPPGAIQPEDLAATAPTEKGLPARTVFLSKTGDNKKSLAAAATGMHDKMADEGWTFADMVLYTEDGDIQGLFITYLKYEKNRRTQD